MSLVPVKSSETNTWNRLWATLLSRLPGIGEDALRLEIGNAIQEFLRETHCWRETVNYNVVAGQKNYVLTPQSQNADVTYVIAVEVDGRPYSPASPDAFDRTLYGVYRVCDPFYEIELHPTPTGTVAKGLKAVLGLSLKPESLDIPDALLAAHFENIIDGVLERCYDHSSKPYSNPEKHIYHHRRFRAALTRTRRITRGGDAQASPSWRFNNQAPGSPKRGARSYGW
jgi:hypothetical protein